MNNSIVMPYIIFTDGEEYAICVASVSSYLYSNWLNVYFKENMQFQTSYKYFRVCRDRIPFLLPRLFWGGKSKKGKKHTLYQPLSLHHWERLVLIVPKNGAKNCTSMCSEVISYTHMHGKVGKGFVYVYIYVCVYIYGLAYVWLRTEGNVLNSAVEDSHQTWILN